ncbi:MAG TPA: cation diffusion facilitator family transporter [Alphaproteobacteria bacterium]|nr:cation diffusion facilitator family transporter [Alphaproteobacteria bacterium]
MAATSSKTVIFAALAGNSAIAVTKFVAASFTGSSAMLAEGIHSLVDTGNQALMLIGLARAKKPADARHPFGYGAEVYFWAFIVAVLIFAVGAGVSLYEGVVKIRNPHPIERAWINYIVLVVAFVFEAGAWLLAWRAFAERKGKRGLFQAMRVSKDPTVFTVLLEDTAAMAGIIVAFAGILAADLTGALWLDGLATLLIGVILALVAVFLAYETKGLLIGEAASPATVQGLRKLIKESDGVLKLHELRTVHFGPDDILVAVSVDFEDRLDSRAVEIAVTQMEAAILEKYPRVERVFIEAQSPRDRAALRKAMKEQAESEKLEGKG